MALQGSIDTFALDDVLRLVAGTSKTGRLTLRGGRGEGELVVREGRVVDGSVTTDERVGDLHELVFELLRFDEGDFHFDAVDVDGSAYDGEDAAEVEGLLGAANELLEEWRDIERVVPGRTSHVTLAPEAPDGTVKIDPGQWRMIAAVGSGAPVGLLSERLDASDLATGRLLRSLAEAGLVSIGEPLPEPVAPVEAVVVTEPVAPEPVLGAAAPTSAPPEPVPAYAPFEPDPWASGADPFASNGNGNGNGNGHGGVDAEVLFESVHDAPAAVAVAEIGLDDGFGAPDPVADEVVAAPVPDAPALDAAEFARRLAELSPGAAKAVAAAARAATVEERQAALAELDGTGEEIDHELLLQLLGPVEG